MPDQVFAPWGLTQCSRANVCSVTKGTNAVQQHRPLTYINQQETDTGK